MSSLLSFASPSVWAVISGAVFFTGFLAYAATLFWPTRRAFYERAGQLPLDGENND